MRRGARGTAQLRVDPDEMPRTRGFYDTDGGCALRRPVARSVASSSAEPRSQDLIVSVRRSARSYSPFSVIVPRWMRGGKDRHRRQPE